MPYSTVSFRMTLSDLAKYSDFSDTKRRAVSLRQLSFLYHFVPRVTYRCSLKMEFEKLAQEKTEMQRHYVMVS